MDVTRDEIMTDIAVAIEFLERGHIGAGLALLQNLMNDLEEGDST